MRQGCRGVASPQDGESFKVMAGRWHGREPVNATHGPFDVPTPRGLLQGVVCHARFLRLFHSHVPVLVSCDLPEGIPTSHVKTVTQRHCSDRNSCSTSSRGLTKMMAARSAQITLTGISPVAPTTARSSLRTSSTA